MKSFVNLNGMQRHYAEIIKRDGNDMIAKLIRWSYYTEPNHTGHNCKRTTD